jgi:hypothetical protein
MITYETEEIAKLSNANELIDTAVPAIAFAAFNDEDTALLVVPVQARYKPLKLKFVFAILLFFFNYYKYLINP